MSDASAPRPEGGESLADGLDLKGLITGLAQDLRDLRSGHITVQQAHARAELARQMLRGIHYVVQAQKFLDQSLKHLPPAAGGEGDQHA